MVNYKKSNKLDSVCYDIRGEVLEEAKRLEEDGYNIIKLNIGNPALFNLFAPDEILHDVIINIQKAQGYSDSKGIFPARKAIMQYCQQLGVQGVTIEDIYLGNGVSELIVMAMNGLLNTGDEILIPAPDYPLWTASVNLAGGKAVHYICDEALEWQPDIKDMESKITSKTKGIVIINPNNPTGAVYSKEILQEIVALAEKHHLILFSDEIYEKLLYEDAKHYPIATLSNKTFVVTFGGLSKSHRIAGFRVGWMILSGNKSIAKDYIEGINILSGMRLCSNVPAQYAIQTAIGGHQSIEDLLAEGGRLKEQRDLAYKMINDIPGISCTMPKGAFYIFPKLDQKRFNIKDDKKMIYDLLLDKKILLVQGTGFNWFNPDHFRVVFLPNIIELKEAFTKMKEFFSYYKQD